MSLDEIAYKVMMKENHQETVVYGTIFDKANTQYVVSALYIHASIQKGWPKKQNDLLERERIKSLSMKAALLYTTDIVCTSHLTSPLVLLPPSYYSCPKHAYILYKCYIFKTVVVLNVTCKK